MCSNALDSARNDNYRTGKVGEVLLVFDASIDGKNRIKAGGGGLAQKNTVANANPTHVGRCENFVARQMLPQLVRQVFIEKQFH
jgi:hypothetical protein